MLGIFSYLVFFLTLALIYGIVSMGLNLQWGYTGLFNIGVAGFFAVGAYAFGILTTAPSAGWLGGFQLPFVVGLVGAMLVSGLVAWLIGLPTLRLRDDYLAIATIGIAVSIQLLALNLQSVTGGSPGLYNIPQPLSGMFSSNLAYNIFFLGVVLLITLLTYHALERMVNSPWGRVLFAIREDETAASSLGKDAFSYRLQSFVIGSMIMGLGGALYASFIKYLSPNDFLPIFTFQIWSMLIVGGSGNNLGAIFGSVLVWGVWTGSGTLAMQFLPASLQVKGGAVQIVIIGLLIVFMLIFKPRGLFGSRKALVAQGRARSSSAPPLSEE